MLDVVYAHEPITGRTIQSRRNTRPTQLEPAFSFHYNITSFLFSTSINHPTNVRVHVHAKKNLHHETYDVPLTLSNQDKLKAGLPCASQLKNAKLQTVRCLTRLHPFSTFSPPFLHLLSWGEGSGLWGRLLVSFVIQIVRSDSGSLFELPGICECPQARK
jgi:hypothetical protein